MHRNPPKDLTALHFLHRSCRLLTFLLLLHARDRSKVTFDCAHDVLWEGFTSTIDKQGGYKEPSINGPGSITLAGVASIDRALAALSAAHHWSGSLSFVFYARTKQEHTAISTFVAQTLGPFSRAKGQWLRVELISMCSVDSDPSREVLGFPINKLRWHSVHGAKTALVLYADIDFMPSDRLAENIASRYQKGLVNRSRDLLVIPCFVPSSESNWPSHPLITWGNEGAIVAMMHENLSKSELMTQYQSGKVEVPGVPWSVASHAVTDYVRWFQTDPEGSLYEVPYTFFYEPYVVMDKTSWRGVEGPGVFDDRFHQWGGDKVQVALEAATLSYRFLVDPSGFLLHLPKKSEPCPEALGKFCSVAAQTVSNWKSRSGYIEREVVDMMMSLKSWGSEVPDDHGAVFYVPPFAQLQKLNRGEMFRLLDTASKKISADFQGINSYLKNLSGDPSREVFKGLVWKWCYGAIPVVASRFAVEDKLYAVIDRRLLEAEDKPVNKSTMKACNGSEGLCPLEDFHQADSTEAAYGVPGGVALQHWLAGPPLSHGMGKQFSRLQENVVLTTSGRAAGLLKSSESIYRLPPQTDCIKDLDNGRGVSHCRIHTDIHRRDGELREKVVREAWFVPLNPRRSTRLTDLFGSYSK